MCIAMIACALRPATQAIASRRSPGSLAPTSGVVMQRRTMLRGARQRCQSNAVQELTSVEDFNAFIEIDSLCVVDYFTTWCGPCKMIAPKVEEMAVELTQVRFAKINLTDLAGAGEFTKEREIKSLPTFHICKKGEKLGQVTGNNPTALRKAIFFHI